MNQTRWLNGPWRSIQNFKETNLGFGQDLVPVWWDDFEDEMVYALFSAIDALLEVSVFFIAEEQLGNVHIKDIIAVLE